MSWHSSVSGGMYYRAYRHAAGLVEPYGSLYKWTLFIDIDGKPDPKTGLPNAELVAKGDADSEWNAMRDCDLAYVNAPEKK